MNFHALFFFSAPSEANFNRQSFMKDMIGSVRAYPANRDHS